MEAVILAAGKGTRLQPLTQNIPKVMLPLSGKPLLEYVIESTKTAGISEITLIVGYKKEVIQKYFGDGSNLDLKIKYVVQGQRLGTAHAIGKCHFEEDFLVIAGDALVSPDIIKTVIRRHSSAATIALKRVENPEDYGVVKLDGDIVKEIIEKPKEFVSDLASISVSCYSPEIFDAIKKTEKSERGEYEITESIKILIDEGKVVRGIEVQGEWLDIGNPWNYLDANQRVLDRKKSEILGKVEENVTIKGPVVIGENSLIKSGSYLEGPIYIGRNSTIGPNAYLRSYATIGDNCKIGNSVEIKNSIIMDGSKIPHLSYVGDSIIGRNCNLGAGTLVGNLRLDNKNVMVRIKGRLVNTGRRKFGCIIGDNSKLGINVMINSGRKIGCNCMIGPGVIVYRDIPDNSFILQKQELEKR
jgi:bifunctional UDP-N-acetylglucosamine pyrophosphorylase/glucosamine-1-phosphate N-acetyltransferase